MGHLYLYLTRQKLKNLDLTRPDPRVNPTHGQLWVGCIIINTGVDGADGETGAGHVVQPDRSTVDGAIEDVEQRQLVVVADGCHVKRDEYRRCQSRIHRTWAIQTHTRTFQKKVKVARTRLLSVGFPS